MPELKPLMALLEQAERERDEAQQRHRQALAQANAAQDQAEQLLAYRRDYEARWSTQFRDKAIHRLTAPESVTYKQVVLFGVRRSRQERERMTDRAVNEGNWKLQQLTRSYDAIPPLPDEPDRQYAVPPAPPARLEYRGLPLDLIEDLLDNSPAWRQAQRITHAPKTSTAM